MSQLSPSQIWTSALGSLEVQISQPSYNTWLKNTVGLSWDGKELVVGVPSIFVAEWLEQRMSSLLEKTVSHIAGASVKVSFTVGSNSPPSPSSSRPQEEYLAATGSISNTGRTQHGGAGLNSKYTLDSFIVGESNQLAYAAAVAVSAKPGQTYNPLFLYSGVGLGKTHLLHAIGHTAIQKGSTCLYVTSEQFTNEFISSIQNRKTPEFREKYRSVDILLVDDIQFIRGKDAIQEGFFHTFNDLHMSNSQIVIASDRPPSELTLLEGRLQSRFEWGLTTVMGCPSVETRIAILQAKAGSLGLSMSPEVLAFMAENFSSSVRDLEGALNRLSAYTELTGKDICLTVAESALADLIKPDRVSIIPPTVVLSTLCSFYRVSAAALSSKRRDKVLARVRQIGMFLLREASQITLVEIGSILGHRDHTSVRYSISTIEKQLLTDPELTQEIADLRSLLRTVKI